MVKNKRNEQRVGTPLGDEDGRMTRDVEEVVEVDYQLEIKYKSAEICGENEKVNRWQPSPIDDIADVVLWGGDMTNNNNKDGNNNYDSKDGMKKLF